MYVRQIWVSSLLTSTVNFFDHNQSHIDDYIRTKILKQNEQEQEEIDKQIEEEQPKEEPENTISPNEKEDDGEEEKPTLGDK